MNNVLVLEARVLMSSAMAGAVAARMRLVAACPRRMTFFRSAGVSSLRRSACQLDTEGKMFSPWDSK